MNACVSAGGTAEKTHVVSAKLIINLKNQRIRKCVMGEFISRCSTNTNGDTYLTSCNLENLHLLCRIDENKNIIEGVSSDRVNIAVV